MNDDLKAAHDSLQTRLQVMETLFCQFAQAGAGVSENVVGGGLGSVSDQLSQITSKLATISAQMAPMAELVLDPPLNEDQQARLEYLIRSLAAPEWNGLSSLSFDRETTRYIGERVPDDGRFKGDNGLGYGSAAR